MAVQVIELVKDDVTGKTLNGDAKRGVPFSFNGKKATLDVAQDVFDALSALTAETPDGSLLRELLDTRASSRAVNEETKRVREWAKAQVNADGSAKYPTVKERGRITDDIVNAYHAQAE